MKAKLLTLTVAVIAFIAMGAALPSCNPTARSLARLDKYPLCDGRGYTSISRLDRRSFSKTDSRSCVKSLDPFDISAWVEAPVTAYTQRNLQKVVLGCSNLVPDAADCSYSGMPGHAATIHSSFDFSVYPALARVQKAVFAFYAEDNAAFLTKSADVRGKLNDGDIYMSLGASRITPAFRRLPHAGWVVVDVTDFAARAINEQRNDTSIDVSLPCGRSEGELATVSVLRREPVLVVEYK
ncbi:MAG: hypothetical protein LBF40_04530 [Deltaproteobacteria bacterium]|jgi:hypothetical protein|nr:hypothetical protein [Deltaproteobacteria bacterium]